MRTRLAAVVAALCLTACNGGTYVTLTLQANGLSLANVSRIDLDLKLAGKSASARLSGNITFPTTTVLDVASGEGAMQITANAVDGSGHIVAQTMGMATVSRGKTTSATLDFGSAVVGGGDMSGSSDAGPCGVCDPAAICALDGTGMVSCACPSGYTGDGHTCTDIDECANGTAHCDANASCTNTPGSFTCSCNAGYSGTGFTCKPVWVAARVDAGFFITSSGGAVGIGNLLYFFSPSSTAANVKFQSWDVTSGDAGTINTETPMPSSTNDFCNCGDTSKLIANPSTPPMLYYFGNYGQSYNTSTKVWSSISTYLSPTDHRRGETGIGILNNVVYWVGDRNIITAVQTYDLNAGTFGSGVPYPIGIYRPGLGVYNNKIYVFGGDTVGNQRTNASYSLATGASQWTPIADAPSGIDNYPDVVAYQSKLWVSGNGGLWTYDPATNLWSATPLAYPTGGANRHLAVAGATPGLYVLVDFPTGMTIYKYNL